MKREPTKYELYLCKVAKLFARITGYAFLIGGTLIGFSFLPNLLDPKGTVAVNGVPTSDFGIRLIPVLLPLLMAVFGWLIVRAKNFYPAYVREWMESQEVDREPNT